MIFDNIDQDFMYLLELAFIFKYKIPSFRNNDWETKVYS